VLDSACPQLQCFQRQVAVLPKLGEFRGQKSLGEMDYLLDELLGFRAKREFDAFGSSEQVCDNREGAALDPVEQERRPMTLDNASMNFGDFEIGVNLCLNRDEVTFLAQDLKKLSEILDGHVRRAM
jgi:hypothetical protein